MKCLVLGATGFIGGHVAHAAMEAGWAVRGLRRNPDSTGHLGDLAIEWVSGDLTDPPSLRFAMEGVEVVFHAAGYYPSSKDHRSVDEQVEYGKEETVRVLDAAHQTGVQRFIYTSSLTTIGHPPPKENRLADERDYYIPGTLAKSGYYEAKIVMEEIVLRAAEEGFHAVVVNPTAVFGPGDTHKSMGGLLIAVERGWMVGWLPGENNVVDVRDVGIAHVAAAERGRSGERYILGGHNLSIREALNLTAQVAQVKPPRFEIPLWLLNGLVVVSDLLPFLPLPRNHLRAIRLWQGYSMTKAQNEFGLTPRPFEETVRDALAWFKEAG